VEKAIRPHLLSGRVSINRETLACGARSFAGERWNVSERRKTPDAPTLSLFQEKKWSLEFVPL
jgi:hypothetical protein